MKNVNIPDNIVNILKEFTGEITNSRINTKIKIEYFI